MKKQIFIIALLVVTLSIFAQSPFVIFESTPSSNQSNINNKEITRITGYIKDFNGFRKVSLQVNFISDSYGKEIVTVVRMLESQSGPFVTSGGNNWKTINSRAYYCNDNCDFIYYARYGNGYIFFDN